jgi:predicted dithiol-disulfide oxidoreductase (DUF899 family)
MRRRQSGGDVRISFANESTEYRTARERLLDEELALRRQMETLAAHRRALPEGPAIAEDYAFVEAKADGSDSPVRLSSLFRDGNDTLLVYCYMFPRHSADQRLGARTGGLASLPADEQPCPSCTALLDQLDPAIHHFESMGGAFAVAANTSTDRLRTVARDKGWKNLRLLSSLGTRFKRDFHAEDDDGQQEPMILVFKRDADGTIRLSWASELVYADKDPGQDMRAFGTIDTFWNLFDFTPHGRPDHNEQLDYDCCGGDRKAHG